MAMESPTYVRRPSFFAHNYCRLLAKACVASELGQGVYTLLSVIVHTEDARGYRGFVSYFNAPLMMVTGFKSVDSLDRARKRAIAAGWLTYHHGWKGTPGRYQATMPPEHADWDMSVPTDDNPKDYVRTGADESPKKPEGKPKGNKEPSSLPLDLPQEEPPTPKGGEGREEIIKALAEGTGLDPGTAKRRFKKCADAMLAGTPTPYTPAEILEFCRCIDEFRGAKQSNRGEPPTLNEITQKIGMLRDRKAKQAKKSTPRREPDRTAAAEEAERKAIEAYYQAMPVGDRAEIEERVIREADPAMRKKLKADPKSWVPSTTGYMQLKIAQIVRALMSSTTKEKSSETEG